MKDIKFKFGDIVENGWAGETNPHKRGVFVRRYEDCIQCTDMKGDFWKSLLGKEHKLKVVGNIIKGLRKLILLILLLSSNAHAGVDFKMGSSPIKDIKTEAEAVQLARDIAGFESFKAELNKIMTDIMRSTDLGEMDMNAEDKEYLEKQLRKYELYRLAYDKAVEIENYLGIKGKYGSIVVSSSVPINIGGKE